MDDAVNARARVPVVVLAGARALLLAVASIAGPALLLVPALPRLPRARARPGGRAPHRAPGRQVGAGMGQLAAAGGRAVGWGGVGFAPALGLWRVFTDGTYVGWWYGFVPVGGPGSALAAGALRAVLLVASYHLTPALLRLHMDPQVIQQLPAGRVGDGRPPGRLRPRELEVLELMAQGTFERGDRGASCRHGAGDRKAHVQHFHQTRT